MLNLRRTKPVLLGVDISKSSVKVVELAQAAGDLELRGYAIVPLPVAENLSRDESRIQIIGAAVRKAVKQAGTRLTHAVTAVPSAAVILKTVTFPANLSEDDIEAQVELEAEQYIPYPLDEVSLDFSVLGQSNTLPGTVDVEVVASRKEYVEDRAAGLEWAGLKAEIVDVESFAMERACHRILEQAGEGKGDEVYAVGDMGATSTTLIVIRGRQVIFTREQTFGGRQLTEEVQKRYGLLYDDAERAKKYGGLPDAYDREVMTPFVSALDQQIERSLHFFQSAQPQLQLKRIFFAGGCASLTGIVENFGAAGGARLLTADPFIGMRISPRANRAHLAKDAPALLTATGLALRSFE